jgi:FemAB-related protein (PEP-CTERM system-associated)
VNAVTAQPGFKVRIANLADPDEMRRIDAFVLAHPNGTPFHLSRWSRAVEKGCGQKSYYLVADAGDERIAGVLPLTAVTSPLFGRALVSSGFAVGGGILAVSPSLTDTLSARALEIAADLKCPTVELRGGALPEGPWIDDFGTYVGFSRKLAGDDEAELLAIPRKQRAEVRRALGFDLSVETGQTARDRDAHYHVYSTSVRNLGTPVFPRKLFDAVLDEFGPDADILTVLHGEKPIASVLSLYFNGTVMPYWGGGTADARTWRANDLMYYALMIHARADKGCTTFDFGRSKVGTGPAAFKRNWGFEPVPLAYVKHVAEGFEAREINPLNPKYKLKIAAWQKLPLPIANFFGPMIAKGLG